MAKYGLIIALLVFGGLATYLSVHKNNTTSLLTPKPTQTTSAPTGDKNHIIIAEGLDTPWAIAFLPDNSMLVTERPGRVRKIDNNGTLESNPVATLSQVKEVGEGGLMGMTLHPEFKTNKYVYFYYTYTSTNNNTLNRVSRMKYENNSLRGEEIIVDAIPGNLFHNGGRIAFGPDKNLYITTGDAQNPSQAQDTSSLAGKILRVTDTGKPVSGNPFSNAVFSYGHRNPQGITWDGAGTLWQTEHGRSGIESGFDEFNRIEPGKNYGWPTIQGDQTKTGMTPPVIHSGATTTWAPAGITYLVNDALYFGGLRGETLYKVKLDGGSAVITEHLVGQYGRIREVIAGPDGMLYISTSNNDGRGSPTSTDDRIIKINPEKL